MNGIIFFVSFGFVLLLLIGVEQVCKRRTKRIIREVKEEVDAKYKKKAEDEKRKMRDSHNSNCLDVEFRLVSDEEYERRKSKWKC